MQVLVKNRARNLTARIVLSDQTIAIAKRKACRPLLITIETSGFRAV